MPDLNPEVDRIQRDLDRTRENMSDKISALKDRLSPGQIIDDMLTQFRGSEGGVFARDFMNSIKNNPMPAALTGIGLAWLMASNPRPQQAANTNTSHGYPWNSVEAFDRHLGELEGRYARGADEDEGSHRDRLTEAKGNAVGVSRSQDESHDSFAGRVTDTIASIRSRITATAHDVRDAAAAAATRVGDTASNIGGRIAQNVEAAPQMAGDLYRSVISNPVMLGAVGLAVGALLGVAIPQSQTEEAALEGVAATARDAAAKTAQNVVDKGADMVQKALDAGVESAKAHGLGGDATLSAIAKTAKEGDLIEGIKTVAKDAVAATAGDTKADGTPSTA